VRRREDRAQLLRGDQAGVPPGYQKGAGGHYEATKHLLEVAYANVDALDELNASEGKDFPSTAIPVVVRLLTTMKP